MMEVTMRSGPACGRDDAERLFPKMAARETLRRGYSGYVATPVMS